MNILNILDEIEKVDAEVYERLNPRRRAFKTLAGFGSKVAVAAVPLALASMFKKAYGQASNDTATVVGVLQFALTLEYLEAEFYTKGAAAAGLVPAGPATGAIATIRDHEIAHVEFLKSAITALGATPGAKPNFDFTAKGTFPTVFTNYDIFLAVAQTFEDTGVRAYKGQAGIFDGIGERTVFDCSLKHTLC